MWKPSLEIPPGWNVIEFILYFVLVVFFLLPLFYLSLTFEMGPIKAFKFMRDN